MSLARKLLQRKSAKIDVLQKSNVGTSEVNKLYKMDDRHEPCGQPAVRAYMDSKRSIPQKALNYFYHTAIEFKLN